MTDQPRNLADLAIRTARMAEQMLSHAHVLTPDPVEQAGVLLTAAFVLIERNVGRDRAATYLLGMIEPQLADWQGAPRHDVP